MIEERRHSEIMAMLKPIVQHSIGSESTFQFFKASLTFMGQTIEKNLDASRPTPSDLEEDIIRNPLQARCKGRPKTGNKRYKSLAEQMRSKKMHRGVTCSSCGQQGHNARTCKSL